MSSKRRKIANPAETNLNLNQILPDLPAEMWQKVGNYLPSFHHIGPKALQLINKKIHDIFRVPAKYNYLLEFENLRTHQSVVETCLDLTDALLILSDQRFLYQATDDELCELILKSPDLAIQIMNDCFSYPSNLLLQACAKYEKVARFFLNSPKFYDLRYRPDFLIACAHHLDIAYLILNDEEIVNNMHNNTLFNIALLHDEIALFILGSTDLLDMLNEEQLLRILENENIKRIALENEEVRAKFTEEELVTLEKSPEQINDEMVEEAIETSTVSYPLLERAMKFSSVAQRLICTPALYSKLPYFQVLTLCELYPEVALLALDNPQFVNQLDAETLYYLTSHDSSGEKTGDYKLAAKVMTTPTLFDKFDPIHQKLLQLQFLPVDELDKINISDIDITLLNDIALNNVLSNATLCNSLTIPNGYFIPNPSCDWLLLRNKITREKLSPENLYEWSITSSECARIVLSLPSLFNKLDENQIYKILMNNSNLYTHKVINTPEIWDRMKMSQQSVIIDLFKYLVEERKEIYEVARVMLEATQPHCAEILNSDVILAKPKPAPKFY